MKCMNDILEHFYASYAYVVYRYAWAFIIGSIALTACLSTGFMFLERNTKNDSYYIITPKDGRYKEERAATVRNWPITEESQDRFLPGFFPDAKHYLYVAATPKPGQTLFSARVLDAIRQLDDGIQHNYTFRAIRENVTVNLAYEDICMTYRSQCFGNGHVYFLQHRNDPVVGDFAMAPPNVTWPVTRQIFSYVPMYLGSLIGKPKYNGTSPVVVDAQALRLVYYTKQFPRSNEIFSLQWRLGIIEYLQAYRSDLIDISYGNEETLNQGLDDTAYKFFPHVVITITLIFVFCYGCSFYLLHREQPKKFIGVDWVRSKPILAVAGLIEPGMAILSTVGLLSLIGVDYNPIIVPMPFIVLSIGVDDMFIMIAAWHQTKLSDPPERRFSHALSDAGVAISITAITDVISFGIGTWNSLAGVQIFCLYTAVAMFFELIYQCTFYAAVMALAGRAEAAGRHCVTWTKAIAFEDASTTCERRFKVGTIISKFSTKEEQQQQDEDNVSYVQKFFRDKYGPILLSPAGKISALVLFLIYLGTSAWGCSIMQNGLQPEKLVYPEHFAQKYLQSLYYWDDGQQISVVVENPPNLTLASGRGEMLRLAEEFENTPYSFGSNATIFWLREYLDYLNRTQAPVQDTQAQWCDLLKAWLRSDVDGLWNSSIRWGTNNQSNVGNNSNSNSSGGIGISANGAIDGTSCVIEAFRFFFASKQCAYPATQVYAVPFFRNISDTYSTRYKVSTYNQDVYPFTDQFLIVNYITIRNSIVAFAVMILISLILIPNPICGLFITLCTVFIDVGVGGYLAWWGVNMDVVSMITMIMATGIAIDLSAHVSYAYVRAEGTPHERATKALESLGWPVFQGVTAMLLGVFVLALADTYMYKTFFKTVFLVIVFGLMHSIVFLPVALTVFAPSQGVLSKCCLKKEKNNRKAEENDQEGPRNNGSAVGRARIASVNGVAAPTSLGKIKDPMSIS